MNNYNDNCQTVTMIDSKTTFQALALINDCNKYKMDLTTNGVVITDGIKFVQTNKEKLTSTKREIKNLKNQIMMKIKISQKKQEEETGEQRNNESSFLISQSTSRHQARICD